MAGNDLAAAILVGGKSRRMGENKALTRLQPGGPTVIDTVVQKLRAITVDIILVGSTPEDYTFLDLPHIPDQRPGIGALGGIHTSLATTTRSHVLIVACDMPFLSVGLLQLMAALPRDYDALVPMLDRPQPLHTIYARSCLPRIVQSFDSGDYRATGWLAGANVRAIDRDTMRRRDPELLSYFNMNTPADVAYAKQILAGATSPEEPGRNLWRPTRGRRGPVEP